LNGALVFCFGGCPIQIIVLGDHRERGVGFGQAVVKLQGLERRGTSALTKFFSAIDIRKQCIFRQTDSGSLSPNLSELFQPAKIVFLLDPTFHSKFRQNCHHVTDRNSGQLSRPQLSRPNERGFSIVIARKSASVSGTAS
jgi:hypothetical protein